MNNLILKGRILTEIKNLINESCVEAKFDDKFKALHSALIKKHFNAAEAKFDYHRRRIHMEIIMNDEVYDPKSINLSLPTLHANFWYKDLSEFLTSCIDNDAKSLGFYVSLLKTYRKKDRQLLSA